MRPEIKLKIDFYGLVREVHGEFVNAKLALQFQKRNEEEVAEELYENISDLNNKIVKHINALCNNYGYEITAFRNFLNRLNEFYISFCKDYDNNEIIKKLSVYELDAVTLHKIAEKS